MSRHDYEASSELYAAAPSFDALIMAALRRADSSNASTLRAAFPAQAAEAQARYDAPGGILASDPDAVDELARRADWAAFVPGAAEDDETRERREVARAWARQRLGIEVEAEVSAP